MKTVLFGAESLMTMARLFVIALICIVALAAIRAIGQVVRKYRFCKRYGIGKLPNSIRIKRSKTNGTNEFELQYPYWSRQKRDGTADRRYKGNYIIWPKSQLWVENDVLSSRRPTAILNTVRALREAEVPVKPCAEEVKKRRELKRKKKELSMDVSLQQIVDRYRECPLDFEQMCAALLRKMGYDCYVTKKTNDGGFDIFLQRGVETGIVECKCYGKRHRVGRPEIQKLVGANVVVKAKKLLFVTTSDFTPEAQTYASKSGVTLVSGQKLIKLLQEYGYPRKEIKIAPEEWQLNQYDLKDYIPEDIYDTYILGIR